LAAYDSTSEACAGITTKATGCPFRTSSTAAANGAAKAAIVSSATFAVMNRCRTFMWSLGMMCRDGIDDRD
jgi:hypothetical protein